LRAGLGVDIHPLIEGRPLIVGGVRIPSERGLDGHSDADVLAHALGDALLGAAGLGDLGRHFPPGDPAWAGVSSLRILERISALVRDAGYSIVNVDGTVLLETPRLSPHIEEMRRALAGSLGIEPAAVSVKATTAERLGPVGRGEGAAALAIALLEEANP
jgi:2-C-methyl-D-erythritol 2,4-cyclodiphosphate synthase